MTEQENIQIPLPSFLKEKPFSRPFLGEGQGKGASFPPSTAATKVTRSFMINYVKI